jgi:hypothetical protein
MVEKNVLLCDSCERSIAICKCGMCNGDMCQACAKVIMINKGYANMSFSSDSINTFGVFRISKLTATSMNSQTICKKCVFELKAMFMDLSKIKREDEKIFVKDLLAFIKYRLPQILTASKI